MYLPKWCKNFYTYAQKYYFSLLLTYISTYLIYVQFAQNGVHMTEETEQDALWQAAGELEFAIHIDNLPEAISELEQSNIVTALEKYKGNKTKAAEELGIGRTNLIAKIRKYNIKVNNDV